MTNVAGPPSGPDIAPTRVLIRGNYNQPGEIVEAGFPSAITGKSEACDSRNRSLPAVSDARTSHHAREVDRQPGQSADGARDGESYLAASFRRRHRANCRAISARTVSVRRIRSCLDWLAVQFVESGWDIKAMHKLMLLSNTYQQVGGESCRRMTRTRRTSCSRDSTGAARSRGDSRQHPRGQRPLESRDGRAERVSAACRPISPISPAMAEPAG